MKIEEILCETEIVNEITRPHERYQAEIVLRQAGYKKLGTGAFAEVYGKKGSEHVLKLFTSRDKAYMEFVKLVIANPNSHFPRFKGNFIRVTDTYYAIRMEWLQPVPDNKETEYVGDILSDYIRIQQNKPKHRLMRTVEEINNAMREMEKTQPGISKACKLIANGISPGRVIDIHNENYMMRDSVLVITDPVAFG